MAYFKDQHNGGGDPRHVEHLLPDYHLGHLNQRETAAVERHLQDCAECRRSLREVSETLDALPLALEQREPPADLKSRVMAEILESETREMSLEEDFAAAEHPDEAPGEDRRRAMIGAEGDAGRGNGARRRGRGSRRSSRQRTLASLLMAAAVMVVGALGFFYLDLREENRQLQAEVEELRSGEVASGAEDGSAEDGAAEDGSRELLVVAAEGTGEAPGARGTAVADPTDGLLALDIYDLPAAPDGHSYHAWLVNPEGSDPAAVHLGEMQLDDQGSGRMSGAAPGPLEGYESIRVTVEPQDPEEMTGPAYLQAVL